MPRRAKPRKQRKPYKDYPLTAHRNGQWCKKVRGRVRFFGVLRDPDAALKLWLEQRDDLIAGREPRARRPGEPELRDLCNKFLATKEALIATGELKQTTFNEYFRVCGQLVDFIGRDRLLSDIRPDDFAALRAHLAKGLGLTELGKRISIVRSIFKFGVENELVTRAVVFGAGFKKPSDKTLRKEQAARPSRMLEAAELRTLLDAAGVQLKAMVFLALNCAYGATDLAELPMGALDLDTGWVTYPRPKTGQPRRAPLWSETVAAVRAALAERPAPREAADAHRVFLTRRGTAWVRMTPSRNRKWTWQDGIHHAFRRLLIDCNLKRPGVSFYSLRHVHRTIADEVNDRPAVDLIMGHTPAVGDMSRHYVERIDDERLRKVTEHIRRWLLAEPKLTLKIRTSEVA